jgi:TorA maturation chaperone TorD
MMYAKSLIFAEGYRLLAAAFRYPEVEELREILTEVLEPAQESAEEIRQLAAPLLEQLDDELAAEYNRLFAQSVAVSPHERAYTGGDLGPGLGQLAALYEAFGLRSGGTEGEVPDHIGAELEFAAFLCLKEVDVQRRSKRRVTRSDGDCLCRAQDLHAGTPRSLDLRVFRSTA